MAEQYSKMVLAVVSDWIPDTEIRHSSEALGWETPEEWLGEDLAAEKGRPVVPVPYMMSPVFLGERVRNGARDGWPVRRPVDDAAGRVGGIAEALVLGRPAETECGAGTWQGGGTAAWEADRPIRRLF